MNELQWKKLLLQHVESLDQENLRRKCVPIGTDHCCAFCKPFQEESGHIFITSQGFAQHGNPRLKPGLIRSIEEDIE
jgi:hypothetical protein